MGYLKLGPLPDPSTPGPIIIEGFGFAITLAIVAAGQWLFGQALRAASEANRLAQDSRVSLSNIVERSPNGILVVDETNTVRLVNEATCRFFGLEKRNFIGNEFPFPKNFIENPEISVLLPDGQEGVAEIRFSETEWERHPARLLLARNITKKRMSNPNPHSRTRRPQPVKNRARKSVGKCLEIQHQNQSDENQHWQSRKQP